MRNPYRLFSIHQLIVLSFLLIGSNSFAQKYKFDYKILRKILETRTPKQNAFYKFISTWNNPVSLSGPTALFFTGLAKNDDLLQKKALYGVETIAGAELVTFSMKFAFNRPRPYICDTGFYCVRPAHGKAFPSGHTSEAFAMATAMSIAVPKWYVMVPAYAWASMVTYARVYLGVHYPTDILAGAVIGSGSAYLMYQLNKWLQKNDKGNHPANEITGLFVGLGSAYVLQKVNQWIHAGKKRKASLIPAN